MKTLEQLLEPIWKRIDENVAEIKDAIRAGDASKLSRPLGALSYRAHNGIEVVKAYRFLEDYGLHVKVQRPAPDPDEDELEDEDEDEEIFRELEHRLYDVGPREEIAK